MGVYCHYQAMPANSTLFRRLSTEEPFAVAYEHVLHRPSGPFEFLALASGLGSLPDLAGEETFAALRTELCQALRDFPGIDHRSAYLKLSDDFDWILIEQLTRLGRPDAAVFTDNLRMGCAGLAGDSTSLTLVPEPTVVEAARWLRRIGTRAFTAREAPDYLLWRHVYLEAAEKGEVIVIGCG
jgi:hypothetical protein